jgi:hypothetical protein
MSKKAAPLEAAEVVSFHLHPDRAEHRGEYKIIVPAVVVEILRVEKGRKGRPEFTASVCDALTGELLIPRPYSTPFKAPMRRFWRRETETDPPEALLGEDRQGKSL